MKIWENKKVSGMDEEILCGLFPTSITSQAAFLTILGIREGITQ